MSNLAVLAQDVSFVYQGTAIQALSNINLKVEKGQIIGICGPSGAGKSTLALCLKGLIPQHVEGKFSGDITLFNKNINEYSPIELTKNIGIVLQDAESQIVGVTVEEDLAYGLENLQIPRNEMRKAINETLKLVGLEGFNSRETASLSGGQKQRVAIAATLVMKPELLILDEPTSELDPEGKADVFKIVEQLSAKSEITIIIIEHELEELIQLADRLILMENGKFMFEDNPIGFFLNNMSYLKESSVEEIPDIIKCQFLLKQRNYINELSMTSNENHFVSFLKKELLNCERCDQLCQ